MGHVFLLVIFALCVYQGAWDLVVYIVLFYVLLIWEQRNR